MTNSQKWWVTWSLVASGVMIYLLAPILTPFVIAALLAYLGDPAVDRLVNMKLPRSGAVVLVFSVLLLLLLLVPLLLLPLIEQQVAIFTNKWPSYVDWLQTTALPWLQTHFGMTDYALDLSVLKEGFKQHWQLVGGAATNIVATITQSGLAVLAWLVNLVLIPVVTFYLLRDWDNLIQRIHQMLPRAIEPVAVRLARESDEVLGAFFRGQLLVMLALGVIYSTGLWIAGLDLALLVGMIAGVVSFVPYLGIVVGLLMAGVASVMQYHDLLHLLPVVAVFVTGQLAESFLLTPWLVGDRLGLHPVAVIFAVMAGGQLFGFVGVLIALPVAAVIMVLLRFMLERYRDSSLYASDDSG